MLPNNAEHALSVCRWWKHRLEQHLTYFTTHMTTTAAAAKKKKRTPPFVLQSLHSLVINFKNHYLLRAEDKLCWQAWPQLRGGRVPADSAKWADIESSWKRCVLYFHFPCLWKCTLCSLVFLPCSVLVSCGRPEIRLPRLPEWAYCKKPFHTQRTVSRWKSGVLWKKSVLDWQVWKCH